MKKILLFSSYPHIIGGSQRQALLLLKQLDTNIHQVRLLTTKDDVLTSMTKEINRTAIVLPLPKSLDVFGKKILFLSRLQKALLLFPFLNYSFQIFKLLRKEKIDVIQCMDERSVLLSGIAALFTNTKVLWYLQTENSIGTFFWNLCIRLSDFIAYNGRFAKNYIPENKRNQSKLIYTVSHLEDEKQTENNNLHWLNYLKKVQGKTIIGVFSSIIPYKGYHHLLTVISELNINNDFVILALGDFPEEYSSYQNWLLKEVERLNIDNITFVGWSDKPSEFMKICDIVVLPSIKEEVLYIGDEQLIIKGNEGLPTVVTEAMQLRKAVVATKVGSTFEQVVNNENGFLIPPSDTLALKKALETLLNNPEMVIEFGEKGRTIFEQYFSSEQFSNNFESVYNQILQ